jgi:hypothetical protein
MISEQENYVTMGKIAEGLKLAIRRLYEQKVANNEDAVIGGPNGTVLRVPARDIVGLSHEEIIKRYA